MDAANSLLASSGYEKVSAIETLVLVLFGRLLLALPQKRRVRIGCTYFMAEEVDVVKVKLRGDGGWTRRSDGSA